MTFSLVMDQHSCNESKVTGDIAYGKLLAEYFVSDSGLNCTLAFRHSAELMTFCAVPDQLSSCRGPLGFPLVGTGIGGSGLSYQVHLSEFLPQFLSHVPRTCALSGLSRYGPAPMCLGTELNLFGV